MRLASLASSAFMSMSPINRASPCRPIRKFQPRTQKRGDSGARRTNTVAAWPLAIITIAETTGKSYEAVRALLDR